MNPLRHVCVWFVVALAAECAAVHIDGKGKAWWFNPRNGKAEAIAACEGMREVTPPNCGQNIDWVLVLDSAAKKYPAPGNKVSSEK
jgi:hypothetical protein